HLEGFGNYENIIKTKKELYDYISLKKGKLFVNSDDELLMKISEGQDRILYGQEEGIIKGEIKQSVPYLVFSLKTLKGDLYVKTHLTGGYNFTNALAAACLGIYFDISAESIRDSLEKYTPSNLRSQLIKTEKNIIILDAYNANPSSMQSSLKEFKEITHPSKVVILGEMLELGKESKTAHDNLIKTILEGNFSQIFLVGKEFEYVNNNYNFINYFRNK
ncbi:MAG: UDP-N-acetylmuramoyl-tripeptide--D-alanyl-D-alanine ligase, partial [Odoribacter sp.]|nr:UDP-N-acetylmuramoyl-tripeptide--D-alanyl-D-alanine ligase [Odoribacter sp.]